VVIDPEKGTLLFGNGINGRVLPAGAAIEASYSISAGRRGNIPAGAAWRVQGIARTFGTNVAAMQGGLDATRPVDLQISARKRWRSMRPIVSASDLQSAALELAGLDVSRAWELPLPEQSGVREAGHRRLVVIGSHADAGADARAFEPPAWLDLIRRKLTPRLALGQRLEVLAPRYTPFRVRVSLVAHQGLDLPEVAQRALEVLRSRFAVVPDEDREGWPLGRSVTASAIAGWLRRVEGVAGVTSVVLIVDGKDLGSGEIVLTRVGLPLFQPDIADIRVTSATRGTSRIPRSPCA
jgi:predicted phage baseplate assembly protein